MPRMGPPRLAKSEDVIVHLHWYICQLITHGKDLHAVSLVDWPHCSQARSVIGPNVVVKNPGFACTECLLAGPFDPDDTETLVISTKDVVEYLDVADNPIHENIRQAVCIFICAGICLNFHCCGSGTCSPENYIKL